MVICYILWLQPQMFMQNVQHIFPLSANKMAKNTLNSILNQNNVTKLIKTIK